MSRAEVLAEHCYTDEVPLDGLTLVLPATGVHAPFVDIAIRQADGTEQRVALLPHMARVVARQLSVRADLVEAMDVARSLEREAERA